MYCNLMYTVATHLVEVKSQQSFSHFIQDRIFQPLGMLSTTLQPTAAKARGFSDRMVTGSVWDRTNSTYQPIEMPDTPESQGAGSIVTSVNDFIKWIKALINHEDPITDELYKGLTRMRSFTNPDANWLKPHTSPVAYAAGLEVWFYRGHMVVGHDGGIVGFGSRFFFLPRLGFGVVILGNASGVFPHFLNIDPRTP